jgi:hypothetical protein
MSVSSEAIRKDWESRELVEVIQLNILQVASFLNQFDMSMRYKLATLNEKLNKLERSLEYCEAAIKTTLHNSETEDN